MTVDKALHQRKDAGILYVSGKSERKDLPSIQKLEEYIKKSKEKVITAAKKGIGKKQKYNENKKRNVKKNNCMDISSDKQARLLTRRSGHNHKRETVKEKLNLF